jgi:hypothetical protein
MNSQALVVTPEWLVVGSLLVAAAAASVGYCCARAGDNRRFRRRVAEAIPEWDGQTEVLAACTVVLGVDVSDISDPVVLLEACT